MTNRAVKDNQSSRARGIQAPAPKENLVAEAPRYPGSDDRLGGGLDHESTGRPNRSMMLVFIVVAVLVVVMIVLHLAGVAPTH